jgi:hypothetical protein
MRLAGRLMRLEERKTPNAQSDAKRLLGEFFANIRQRIEGAKITSDWIDNASPVEVLAAGMNHAEDLPSILNERLHGFAKDSTSPVAAIARSILEYRK